VSKKPQKTLSWSYFETNVPPPPRRCWGLERSKRGKNPFQIESWIYYLICSPPLFCFAFKLWWFHFYLLPMHLLLNPSLLQKWYTCKFLSKFKIKIKIPFNVAVGIVAVMKVIPPRKTKDPENVKWNWSLCPQHWDYNPVSMKKASNSTLTYIWTHIQISSFFLNRTSNFMVGHSKPTDLTFIDLVPYSSWQGTFVKGKAWRQGHYWNKGLHKVIAQALPSLPEGFTAIKTDPVKERNLLKWNYPLRKWNVHSPLTNKIGSVKVTSECTIFLLGRSLHTVNCMAIAFEVSSMDSILIHGFLIPSTLDWLFNLPFWNIWTYVRLDILKEKKLKSFMLSTFERRGVCTRPMGITKRLLVTWPHISSFCLMAATGHLTPWLVMFSNTASVVWGLRKCI